MRRLVPGLLAIASIGLLISFALIVKRPGHGEPPTTFMQTYIALKAGPPVSVPRLVTASGSTLAPGGMQGHWSVIFFGFTACPLVCPKTLGVMTAMARDPESGVLSGTTQPVFVSVDVEHDTPESIRSYLAHFDRHIMGLTGSRIAIDRFSRDIGAGSQSVESGIDHSTSLFVLDPKGRVAGILLRPSDPLRIVADLKKLRFLYDDARGR